MLLLRNYFEKNSLQLLLKKYVKKAIIQFRLNANTNALVNYRIKSLKNIDKRMIKVIQ